MTIPNSAEIEELRREARDLIGQWRDAARFQPRSDNWMRGFDGDFSRELAKRGLTGLTWPREYGGQGRGQLARLAVNEELLRAGAPVAAHWIGDRQIGPAVMRHGSPELRKEILPGIAAAQFVFCLGMSEPDAGSDLAAVRTMAVPAAGGWRVSGRKIWTTGAHHATHIYLLARTQRGDRKHEGLTEFIVDMDTPGVSVAPIVDLAGEHHFNEVTFSDVFVPEHRLLGTVGGAWRQVTEQLSFERGGPERFLSTYPLFALVLEHAGPEHRAAVGRLVARLATLRRLAWNVAASLDAGAAPIVDAATLKYLGNAFENDVVDFARQTARTGTPALAEACAQALLASPGFTIRGGAADVLLSIIAKQETRP
ncbi:acyl-CoA dehydrogenase family protein [Yinghuangia soli]|uniref:Acyl-CoA dehydrogenase family protein n=1 Tax=Yinghuangia soli TaxID=2908204 RepID=A0AA41Q8N5_9ACTN|nr:acyl-CoA dehydrogenase family protein [Yinghuangia soli]MCF2533644.1 acyl-CoA dehydrogenase family protein [Yinghuangia soli]